MKVFSPDDSLGGGGEILGNDGVLSVMDAKWVGELMLGDFGDEGDMLSDFWVISRLIL